MPPGTVVEDPERATAGTCSRRPARRGGARRRRRARQQALRHRHPPDAALRRARAARRGALARAAAQAARRRRPGRAARTPASPRCSRASPRAQPKVADYPFTTLEPVLGTLEARRPPARDRRHPRPDRGRQRGRRPRARVPRPRRALPPAGARARPGAARRLRPGRATTRPSRRELREHGARPGRAAAHPLPVQGRPRAARAGGREAVDDWRGAARRAGARHLRGHRARGSTSCDARSSRRCRAERAASREPATCAGHPPGLPARRAATRSRSSAPARAASGSRAGGVERLFARHDVDNEEALRYLEDRLRALGVIKALEAAGFEPGDDVEIAGIVFELDPGLHTGADARRAVPSLICAARCSALRAAAAATTRTTPRDVCATSRGHATSATARSFCNDLVDPGVHGEDHGRHRRRGAASRCKQQLEPAPAGCELRSSSRSGRPRSTATGATVTAHARDARVGRTPQVFRLEKEDGDWKLTAASRRRAGQMATRRRQARLEHRRRRRGRGARRRARGALRRGRRAPRARATTWCSSPPARSRAACG